jgi:hypothetical protein
MTRAVRMCAPAAVRRALLVPGVPLVPAPVTGPLGECVKVNKARANVPGLQQKASASGGRVLWRAGAYQRVLDPLITTPVVPVAPAPAQIPMSIRQYDGYVAGQTGTLVPPQAAAERCRRPNRSRNLPFEHGDPRPPPGVDSEQPRHLVDSRPLAIARKHMCWGAVTSFQVRVARD